MKWAVETRNVSKKYGSKRAIDNLTVSFPKGQITGLLGHNGAGKSTLFKMIVGLVRANSGDITVFGNAPSWRHNANIAYLPDRARWYGYQTVHQALAYANSIFPLFNLQRAREMAQFMSLDPGQKISDMSKGEEARLLLILCLARDAELVLLDEPFSGIDLISREKIVNAIIDSMIDRQQTIIISTHEIHEAESLFDHVVLLDQGRVVLAEDAESLRAEKGSIESVYRSVFR